MNLIASEFFNLFSKNMPKEKNYEEEYSVAKFWKKVKKVAKKAGSEIIQEALKLLYVIIGKKIPLPAKTLAIGALGYFISPIDAIPDITPVVGYADDLGVIALAISSLKKYITPKIEKQAKEKSEDIFGE